MSELVSVIIPVRDVGNGLPRLIDGWREAFQKLGREARFIIVDAGCDSRIDIKPGFALVLRNEQAGGLGACIRNAINESKAATAPANYMILVPEFAYRPTDLRALFDAFKDVDMVIGVRPGQGMPPWLTMVKRVSRFLSRWLFGIPAMDFVPWYGWSAVRSRLRFRFLYGPRLQDPGTGLILVRRAILERSPIQSEGSFAILELIAKANFLGAMIAEVKLSKPSDMPVMKGRFAYLPQDERIVSRHPKFLPMQNTTGTDDKSSAPMKVD